MCLGYFGTCINATLRTGLKLLPMHTVRKTAFFSDLEFVKALMAFQNSAGFFGLFEGILVSEKLPFFEQCAMMQRVIMYKI